MNNTNPAVYDDEIDLFELAQELWLEKVLIILVTSVVSLATLVYVFAVPTVYTYTAEATLKVASLHKYGELAAAMQTDGKQGLNIATELVATGFERLRDNLGSQRMVGDFLSQNEAGSSFNALIKIPLPKDRVPISSAPLEFVGEFTLNISGTELLDADKMLESYLDFVAKNTVEELNDFLAGMRVNQGVEVDMLYQLDSPRINQSVQAKPNKKLIVAVGIVAGAMLGVFAALLRTAIRKRRTQIETA